MESFATEQEAHADGRHELEKLIQVSRWLCVRPGWPKVKRTPTKREQEITLGEMRATGATHLLVYCGDYKCAHSHVVNAGRWPDHVRLSDLEPLFICRSAAFGAPMFGR